MFIQRQIACSLFDNNVLGVTKGHSLLFQTNQGTHYVMPEITMW